MIYIDRYETDPYFNIAAEEYVLKAFSEDVFMLWQNSPSVIIGKHQNAHAEINHQYIQENNIPVIRRISGGGTVYHDLGNLNFSFVKNGKKGELVNFEKFTTPIINALGSLGIEAKFEGKNDLRVEGKKISGNAEHVYKSRVLHHGTLLFSSELDKLNTSIKVQPKVFIDKAVQSNRSEVANITEFLKKPMSLFEFRKEILDQISQTDDQPVFYSFTDKDKEEIQKLVNEKYASWVWNFGYSPKYTLRRNIKIRDIDTFLSIDVKDGVILNVKFENREHIEILEKELNEKLTGKKHHANDIKSCLASSSLFEQDEIKTILQTLF